MTPCENIIFHQVWENLLHQRFAQSLDDPHYLCIVGPRLSGDQGIEILEMSYPPKKPEGRIVGEGPEAAAELIKLLRDEAQVI